MSDHQNLRKHRKLFNRGFVVVCVATASLSVIILLVLLTSVGLAGWRDLDLDLLTSFPSRKPAEAGVKAALWGSVAICTVCGLSAIPLGIGTAVLLVEYKPKRAGARYLHQFIEINIRNLAGVPSIVYGIIALTAFVQMFGIFGNLSDPAWTIGRRWHHDYTLVNGDTGSVAIDGPDVDATALFAGSNIDLQTFDGGVVSVLVLGADEELPSDASVLAVYEYEEPYPREERLWYYLQLPFGRGVLAGGLTLMLVILPIVIISTSEALRAVPNSLREGALAAGATRWQMIRQMTLPAAIPGIMTGSILAMSRAIGEAAPILVIAGGLVFVRFTPEHLMDEFTALPLQIYNWASRPQEEFHHLAASGIIVLLLVLFAFNAVAVAVRQIFQKPLQ